jgi:CheY-like chemotaxis protein
MGGTSLTVLVVDDDEGCRTLYREWLAGDHEVREAASGEEGLEALDASVDVVLLDREMPGISGIDVAGRIAAAAHDPHVAMISSAPFDVDLAETPIHRYVRKPVDEDDVRGLLAEYRTRRDYETAFEEFFSLTSKVAALEADNSREELDGEERYERLRWRAAEKRVEVDLALQEAGSDWSTAFRTFGPDVAPDSSGPPV